MKKIKSFIIAFLLIKNGLYAQCVDKGISTDASNPQNTEKPESKNRFFWFPYNGNNHSQIDIRLSGTQNADIVMNNPYWQASSNNNSFEQYALYGGSDFYPQDGWELIKADFGKLASHSTSQLRTVLPTMAYFCLYNKYSGIMRFMGAFPTAPNGFHIAKFKVSLLKQRRGTSIQSVNNLDATNLLSIQGNSISTLDEETNEDVINVVTEFPGAEPGGYFFWFDIPVAYDPCICYNNSAIEISGELFQISTLDISGNLLGTIQTTTTSSSNQYSSLVAKKVVAAGVALGIGVATQGAVIQTGKFVELIELITNNPNIDNETKGHFNLLQQFLTSSSTLTRKDGGWSDAITNEKLTDEQFATAMMGFNNFVSSGIDLAIKGGGNNSITTVNGKIVMSGTNTGKFTINQTPYWAVPGSSWASSCEEEISLYNSISQEKKPEYPLYNEALGTFAFIKKPKFNINLKRTWEFSENQFLEEQDPINPNLMKKKYWSCDGFKLEGYLPEDLLFTVNPKLNINTNNTKIKVALYVDCQGGRNNDWSWELMNSMLIPQIYKQSMNGVAIKDRDPINFVRTVDPQAFMSVPVDINEFRELYFKASFIVKDYNAYILPVDPVNETDILQSFKPNIYLKYFIEFESNNNGKNRKPIKNIQVFTVPISYESFEGEFPLPKLNLIEEVVELDNLSGIVYSVNTTIYAKKIRIKTNLRTINGAKVKIIATEEIEIDPNSKIDSDIELLIQKSPFRQLYPQSMKNQNYIKNFCENKLTEVTYRAKEWATSILPDISYEDSTAESEKYFDLIINLMPNPTSKDVTIEVFNSLDKDYQITIFDVAGKLIFSRNCNGLQNRQFIETSNLAAGVYFVKVVCGDAQKTEKLIISSSH